MNLSKRISPAIMVFAFFWCISCEDFVDIPAPDDKLIRGDVFDSEETTLSALMGIYNQLALAAFSSGGNNSVSFLSAISADNLKNLIETNLVRMEFEQNELQPDNQHNFNLWSSAYNIIYLTNSFLEGIEGTDKIDTNQKEQWEGEVKFIRAFTYFYLVNLYGEVPLILTTDYRHNELAERVSRDEVYSLILDDLHTAVDLLPDSYTRGERTQVISFAAMGLLARVYLYMENWEMAENFSSQVIEQNSLYEIQNDLEEVFKANSRESLWQISPEGRGQVTTNTNEGSNLIIHPVFSFTATVKLNEDFVAVFSDTDKRLSNWIGYNSSLKAYYTYKYKIRNSTSFPIEEYSMVLRLAEQYLIRAEAKARQDKILEAMEDLDFIQNRASVQLLSETKPDLNQEDILYEILKERRKELFTEWGHRWLDLKRTGYSEEILGLTNPFWEETDVNYPIPDQERVKNNNLTQNTGY